MPHVDPRLYDAVVFVVPPSDSTSELIRKLQRAGVVTEVIGDAAQLGQALRQLGVRAERSVVVADTEDGVTSARDAGFAFVIRLGGGADLVTSGADGVVGDLNQITARTGDLRMSEIPNALALFDDVIDLFGARRPMVALDYDGTLSPIVPDPAAATLVGGAADILARLATQCPVAILSGRDLADVRDRVAVAGIWYAGSHGFESIAPDGSHHRNDDATAAVPVLEKAADELRDALSHVGGINVEHKRFAVAMHYRDAPPERVGDVVAAAHRLGRRAGLRVTNGRKVVELRPDVDWNKGTTLSWIREQIGDDVAPVFIGDDLTDEDGFDAVRSDGVGIVVRHTEDGDRPSAARFTLDDPDQVREFLDHLADRL